jgi:hypothetical protein
MVRRIRTLANRKLYRPRVGRHRLSSSLVRAVLAFGELAERRHLAPVQLNAGSLYLPGFKKIDGDGPLS